ncbi:MAG: hypothetical protein IRY89_10145 [Pseudolabrys sp.]|nr:hypothetical protein [Pseudolabrys sp.]
MRDNSSDRMIERNYLQKRRNLINEYEKACIRIGSPRVMVPGRSRAGNPRGLEARASALSA